MVGLVQPSKYGEHFHELYTNSAERKLHDKSGIKRNNNKDKKAIENVVENNEQTFPAYSLAHIELKPNASKFSVFSAIRSAVLEADAKNIILQDEYTSLKRSKIVSSCCLICTNACLSNNLVECSCHTSEKRNRGADSVHSDGDTETDEASEKEIQIAKVPLIVGAGLRSLFELIADARNIQPNLCTKALKALFDVIQGQQPESFKSEPEDLINPLYDLLLDLATMCTPPGTAQTSHTASYDANWSNIACSSLIGLCIARGDTGKILKAIAALLKSPKQISAQIIKLPLVLFSLQRTVMSAALNKPIRPDFHSHGVPQNSLVDEFSLRSVIHNTSPFTSTQPVMASDGTFIYLLYRSCLLKVGTGFNGSFKGHVYATNTEFGKDSSGWLGFCAGKLYFKRFSKRFSENILLLNADSLATVAPSNVNLPMIREGLNYVIFSDEESINMICTSRDDSLLVRQIYNSTGILAFDLPLKLARKKFRTLGYAAFEDEVLNQNQIQKIQSSYNIFEPKLPTDIEIQGIACGKEFGLVKASNGKVYYYGKSPSLGLKAIGRTPTMKITELIISKVSNIVQVAVGHDGIHALLVNDDGTVYFAGTARRGEDGDSSKNRRAPKAVKPKRLTRIDGHVVIQAACNNGTSAFVTKTGRLIMFGKDTAHCDAHGYVTDFSDQHITKVALGKAHCVVLNSKGQLFTFGLNNKGQCGRSFNSKSKDLNYSIEPTISSQSDSIDGKPNERRLKYDIANLCDFDDHHVAQGQCRVCVVCKECTGYNISCVSSLNVPIEDRVVGEICPCGHGDAGCSKCGLCSACIAVQETEQSDPKQMSEVPRQRSKTIVFRRKDKQPREENNMPSDVDKDPPRVAPLPPQHLVLASNSPVVQIACGLHHTVVLTLTGEVYTFGSNQYGQLGTGDLQSISGPVAVKVQGAISQIAAGSNHTVLLTHKGIVYTFGNYQKGQLGRLPNDFNNKSSLHDDALKHIDPNKEGSTTAALLAQRQKFLWNCNPGAVFGLGPNFGKKATWIGASGDQTFIKIDESLITTHILPKISVVADKKTILLIPTIPLTFHALTINRRDGSCTAHYNNQVNFVQIIQSNRNSELPEINQNIDRNVDQMSRSMHESRNQIFEVQENQMLMGVVDQRKRRRQEPKSPIEKPMPQIAFALDPQFNVLWVFDGGASKSILCYNVLASEIPKNGTNSSNFRAILSPELSLPTNKPDSQVSRSQASLNLLACLDVFTSAQDLIPSCFEDVTPAQQSQAKESLSNDYQILNRFDNFGGGWGYSGHSVEAIRFSCDTDVLICGFGMFGGRGEYSCKLKLFDLGIDGGGYEKDGVLISETKEIPFECPARSKYHIMLPKAVTALSGRWYLVWARIAGPSSDCGSAGQAAVTSEDQIMFAFKNSKKANNGTDINSGQIPSILYRLITQESKQPTPQIEIDPVQKISKSFANTVTKECFESLVSLLKWSWDSFKRNIREQRDKTRPQQVKQSLEYLIYVNKSCLRLLRKYTNEIYPQKPLKASAKKATDASLSNGSKSTKPLANAPKHFLGASELSTPTSRKANMENVQLAECIGNVRALLIEILNDDIFKDICSEDGYRMVLEILEECHTSFVACFDAFYPTSSLKWNCLCDLLLQMDEGNLHSRLLSAIIAGLCSPSIKLRTTFSLLTSGTERQSIVSPSDNFGLPMLSSSENHQYPILVEQMIYRTQQEKTEFTSNTWSFKDVLVRLLNIISSPVKDRIENIYNHSVNVNDFVLCKDINQGLINNCCHLLARVLAEIVYQTSLNDFERAFLPPRSLHSTGNRFSRCDVSRTWNTGNFGPDAIAFTVDRPGIAISGATMYSGSGSYDYQLELLYDNTVDLQATGHKWETLESVSGSYDQEAVHNEMAEIKFERPVHVKENTRYALRLCSQGARTCSGDSGVPSIRGPCGTTFTFYSCDLSFNGTTPARGQIPCILYYSNPIKADGNSVIYANQVTARDTALQVATDITKKCTELLILARNALAASLSPSDNSSNHTQTIDSEHNITPIEEHMDINWANNSRTSALSADPSLTTARDITKRIESFSKGLMETFKFDKRSTNPFDIEIEIGATEIHPKDLIEDSGAFQDLNYRNGHADTKLNGNDRTENDLDADKKSDSDDGGLGSQMTVVQLLEVFNTSSANVFHTLLPLIYAQIGTLACSDPKSSVQILGLIKEILPHVAALNQLYASKEYSALKSKYKKVDFSASDINKKRLDELDKGMDTCTTSNHYCIVESEHPYRSGSITCQRVEFPPCVQWLAVEFDIQCGTAQLEDYLLISIPVKPIAVEPCPVDNDYLDMLDNNMCMQQSSCKNATVTNYTRGQGGANTSPNDSEWAVIKKFNSSGNWVQNVIVLPGNRVEFSLETASLYAQDPHINRFGFKCLVVGYDNPTTMNAKNSCLIRLEHELAYLGGMCSANLMKKDLNLPDDKEVEDLSTIEETLTNHHALLSKGFALSESILTVNQALESYLPIGSQSNERQFLKDFISGAPGSSGARLATWLQPESRLDPNKCELSTIDEALRYGWPTQITVKIKDQYGAAVLVPELKVEIKAIPSGSGTGISNGNIKMRRISCNDAAAFGGIPPPPRLNYETTIKEKMCFKAISFMKPYNNYSFEELRFCSPVQTRITETLFAQDMEDGTFSVHWTPNAVGSYCLTVAIDGIPLEEVYRVEVKEGGIPPPSHKNTLKKSQPPNKLRKFITMNSAGLRIRSHPTLQSEQVGVIKLNGIISFIDEIENDDGIWLRLSTESIRQHCNIGWYPTEAWCLQFNQHLGKTLLYPVTEATTNTTTTTATTNNTTAPAGNTTATTSTPKSGSKLKHRNLLENIGSPLAVPPDTPSKPKSATCSTKTFDFSQSRFTPPKSSMVDNILSSTNPFALSFMSSASERSDDIGSESDNKAFETQVSTSSNDSHNQQEESMATSHSSSPSNIGSAIAGVVGGGASKLQALQKWFKGDTIDGKDSPRKKSECGDIAPISARDLIRAIGVQEPKGNGNGSAASQSSRSSSPMQIPKPFDGGSSRNLSKSAETSDNMEFPDKSGLPSSILVDDPAVSKVTNHFGEPIDFSADDNVGLSSNVLPTPKHVPRRSHKKDLNDLRVNSNLSNMDINIAEQMDLLNITGDDNIFSAKLSTDTDTQSPPLWPPGAGQESFAELKTKAREAVTTCPLKRAMPPSLAESLRAVFAAFLWHEGVVHDAMACASFLKFHPSLPKEGATVITRRESGENKMTLSREQKAQQRHSVEVANAGNYLNIRPSTLEALTKCGNSCLNNRKYRKNMADGNDSSESKVKLHPLPEIVTVLPPALRCLVYLWEQVCRNCIQIVQSNTLERQKSSSPTRDSVSGKEKVEVAEKDDKKSKKKKKDDGYWCELCEIFLPIPVTYHMRTVHPGCGKSAKGKGYNSVGIFCEGWAGNCGEGGKGASSWFLMCDACREKHVSSNKNINNINNSPNAVLSPEMNIFGVKTTTLLANSEVYTTMKENAIFLLELSTSNTNLPPATTKRSPQQMPVVAEHQLNNFSELNIKPSTSRGDSTPNFNFNRHSRVGLRITSKLFGQSTPNRKSLSGCISPDFMWLAPETFACLESLGTTIGDDLPYEIFGGNSAENCYERPLSEISFESCDPNNYDAMTSSATAQGSGTLSKFHRSFSMGQGWSNQQSFNIRTVVNNIVDESQQPKVVFRRRNNSANQGEGSLLICYPSENLRKLVPENLFNTSIATLNSSAPNERLNVEPTGEQIAQNKLNNANSFQGNDPKLEAVGCKDYFFGSYDQPTVPEISNVMEMVDANINGLNNRPSISFITQKHDLEKLRYAMKRSLRIATCRIYSLQALNWLIRSVTQSVCLHDLMWWFVASLSPILESGEIAKLEDGEISLEHPVSFTQISGGFCHIITQSLHVFLQSVADLTLYLPAGSPLQRIAIQSFGIKFRQTDHQFLHNSHVFGNISKILSKSDEQNEAMMLSTMAMGESNIHEAIGDHNFVRGSGAKSLNYTDLNGMFEITVSSRQAMAESLTDNSTETFWESDEEDRNKCKIIEVSMSKLNYTCKTILVHIDNSRDIQNKVVNVVFFAGQSLGDTTLIKSVDIDTKACAWASVKIMDDSFTHFRLEFRGPDNTLRVRQIKLLGLPNNLDELTHGAAKANLKLTNATRIQQQICEAETLRVFRLITAQVFGKLIATGESNRKHSTLESSSVNSMLADSLDLREHMVGILFSRSKLSNLQKQVIVHIVHAIKKEAQRAKEEWEIANVANYTVYKDTHTSSVDHKSESSCSERERFRAPDTYCFEMLSMVLALSGSAVGRSYLSHQHGLLRDLLSLLHTGSDRVQRQVTALLRRILPEITPEVFADLLCVQKMPPFDFNIVNQNPEDFDMNRLGILDIFLAVIAKSLQLQVKVKTTSMTSKTQIEKNPSFVRLCNSVDLSVHQLRTIVVKPKSEENEIGLYDVCMSPFGTNSKILNGNVLEYPEVLTLKRKPKDVTKNINQRWFLKSGVISMKQAESIINLIKDMASGKLSDKWSRVTKAAIAESVLNLTRLEEIFRSPENCIKTATLWLALASLCVLDKEHVEKLSSGQWSKVSDSRPMCSNHDDGETAAIIQCETCGSLCGDCDRFLHLNRKTRNHKRTVCKEEEEAIRVELHESCGRTKLFWLLALADSKTLKGMVEFRDGSHTIISGPQEAVGRCRFCGVTGNSGLLEIGNVCSDVQCQEYNANSCLKTKPCGHVCGGVANEKKCLPCLQHVCHSKENELAEQLKKPKLTQDADDMCMICFVEALSCAPSIHLDCGHVFHYHCCKTVLEKRWTGPRITFGFSLCPICKADILHDLLDETLEPINVLKQDVKRKALMRIKYEGIVKASDPKDLTNIAMDRYAYYVCFKCNKAYYGGEARCDAEIGEIFDPEELVCGACSDVARAQMCPKHGTDFLEYKCRYCCSVAVFFCFGTTHFCDTCHDDFQRLTNIPKNKLPQCPAGPKAKQLLGEECPLHVIHPPTGEEFALGCGICRNAQTF